MSDPATRQVAEDVAADTTDRSLKTLDPEGSDLPPLREFNVFATFDDTSTAREALVALERRGIDGREISLLALHDDSEADQADVDITDDGDIKGTGSTVEIDLRQRDELAATGDHDAEVMGEHMTHVAKGAGIGAIAGGLGTAAVLLAIPGVGVAVGAGILGAAAGGAFAGTGVGAFAGAVTSTPAAKGWQHAVADLDHGRVVVGVHSVESERHNEALGVLAGQGAISVRELDSQGEPL